MLRVLAGLGLILHGLGHAVLPMRGLGSLSPPPMARTTVTILAALAIVAFVASGVGVIGARPFKRWWQALAATGLLASLAALLAAWQRDLLFAPALDLAIAGVLVARRNRVEVIRMPAGGRSWIRRSGRIAAEVVAGAFVLYVAAAVTLRPFHRYRGTTDAERWKALPGDLPFAIRLSRPSTRSASLRPGGGLALARPDRPGPGRLLQLRLAGAAVPGRHPQRRQSAARVAGASGWRSGASHPARLSGRPARNGAGLAGDAVREEPRAGAQRLGRLRARAGVRRRHPSHRALEDC